MSVSDRLSIFRREVYEDGLLVPGGLTLRAIPYRELRLL